MTEREHGWRHRDHPERAVTLALEDLSGLVASRSIIVCCGSGGVGKTTTAAAIAVRAAGIGRRVCVVTIDPAKRLADALGIDSLTNQPTQVTGAWSGELWALMLDTKSTFDDLIMRYSGDSSQSSAILSNRVYRNLSSALSGTQEYMAMEKLFELHNEGHFDLLVIDTPPTRNALDFLDAPRRLTRFLDNRMFRVIMTPTRTSLRAVGIATQAFLRTISKVVGSDVVNDAVGFFTAFEGMEAGFKNRAQEVLRLLSSHQTAFVLVAAPRADAVEEALYFARRLQESSISVQGLVVNRLHPRFGAVPAVSAHGESGADLQALVDNLRQLDDIGRREEAYLATLTRRVEPAPVARVPFLADDVHDLDGLNEVGTYLFSSV